MTGWIHIASTPLETSRVTEARIQHADGSWHIHEGVGSNLSHDPAIRGFVLTLREITERKQAEAEREKLIAELEAKNAELERFTYTVSHDLKSPLITIRGFLGFLERDALAGQIDRLKADIARITEATNKMQYLLDDLLELSRIGRLMNPPQEVPFDTIVREAVEMVQGRIQARGVMVEIGVDLPVIRGDRARLLEVVQNLVDNAVKFMGDQPQPRVEIGCGELNKDQQWVFFVRDNGSGIDPRYHQRVFDLFEKLDSSTEGTGVGLTLARRIIEVHGGRIWVESEGQGKGSTFFFTLPMMESDLTYHLNI
jgi:signal transduction histidine kinase